MQSSAAVLYDALNTLIRAMLPSSRNRLTPAELAPFVQSLLQGTPSSSSAQVSPQPTFVDILLDVIWTLDADIEERSVDAGALSKAEDDKAKVAAAHTAKASADSDKASIAEFLRHLLVSDESMFTLIYNTSLTLIFNCRRICGYCHHTPVGKSSNCHSYPKLGLSPTRKRLANSK